MKKFFLTIALVAVAATTAMAQISVGAGYLSNTIKYGDNKTTLGGFYVGGDYEVYNVSGIGITPGLYFAYGSKSNTSGISGVATGTGTTTQMYLGVPINFTYKIPVTNGLAIVPYLGPTFAFGLSNKYKVDASTIVGSGSNTTDIYSEDSNYKRFDLLIGGGVALDIVDMIRVSFGYNYGLINRNGNSSGSKRTTSDIHFGVAYLF